MKVLHIGWGFRPWRGGGLIEYAEDLMDIQSNNDWDIFYFFSGRHYPFIKTKLKKWKNRKINMFELINSPIFHAGERGTLFPLIDTEENKTEIIFREVLDQIKPNIIHIHELAGLPSSLIDIIKDEYNIPLIMTLHDYFLFCPTLKLFKYNNEICFENEIGKECSFCCKNAPANRQFLIFLTFMYMLGKYRLLKPAQKINYILNNFSLIELAKKKFNIKFYYVESNEKVNLYQKRREINIKKLEKIDLLIAQSYKVEQIYRNFLKSNNIITLHSTVKHLDLINPKKIDINLPIKFATLNGCASPPKGSKLILESIKILNDRNLKNFEFHILGGLDNNTREILKYKNVHYHGVYDVKKLDKILNDIDIGIIPSVWEEVYGYTGIEFLAKGIPVIGNRKGGIIDYTIDNLTGWVNKTSSSEELANIIENIIKNPKKIEKINRKIIKNKKIIKSMDVHFDEINRIYKSLIK